jgi:hypothetical protein
MTGLRAALTLGLTGRYAVQALTTLNSVLGVAVIGAARPAALGPLSSRP